MTDASFEAAVKLAFEREVLKKLVFSKPRTDGVKKVSCRLCAHRGQRILAVEYTLRGDTVSQKNVKADGLSAFLTETEKDFGQIDLITDLGNAEVKDGKKGQVALGLSALTKKLSGQIPAFEKKIADLDTKKQYILSGNEEFLKVLGVSDKNGRVHDKKQGKFRQINRFLEHVGDIYGKLPAEGKITVFDLCCGKSYLSFAVYYYLTEVRGREVSMLGIDLKEDVIAFCDGVAKSLNYAGMRFVAGDITKTPTDERPDLVISLHACDIATDIVLDTAIRLRAKVILSTPCCHRYLTGKIKNPDLAFVTCFPHLSDKLCEALTDAIRAQRLTAAGYRVSVPELTDPDDTPKNTLIRAVLVSDGNEEEKRRYEAILDFVLGDGKASYLDFLNH